MASSIRSRISLLVVEDDAALLDTLKEYLEAKGYSVHPACEREEAETLLHKFRYSVVITDLALNSPQLGGLDIIATSKALPQVPKVIVLTGHNGSEVRNEAHLQGADAFINKPASLSEIAAVVDSLLGASA